MHEAWTRKVITRLGESTSDGVYWSPLFTYTDTCKQPGFGRCCKQSPSSPIAASPRCVSTSPRPRRFTYSWVRTTWIVSIPFSSVGFPLGFRRRSSHYPRSQLFSASGPCQWGRGVVCCLFRRPLRSNYPADSYDFIYLSSNYPWLEWMRPLSFNLESHFS